MTDVVLPPDVAAKVIEGHDLANDPPANILSSVRRWTCKTCGDAVLSTGTVIYGDATKRTCSEALAYWKAR